jgi:hypothetical protein
MIEIALIHENSDYENCDSEDSKNTKRKNKDGENFLKR